MDPNSLRPGMQCTTSDGSLVLVEKVMPDNIYVQVKYVDSLDNPDIPVGSVQQIPFEEIIGEDMGTHAEGLT